MRSNLPLVQTYFLSSLLPTMIDLTPFRKYYDCMNKRYENPNLPYKDPKVMAHLFGLGLDCSDGHKRLTQAEKFSSWVARRKPMIK